MSTTLTVEQARTLGRKLQHVADVADARGSKFIDLSAAGLPEISDLIGFARQADDVARAELQAAIDAHKS